MRTNEIAKLVGVHVNTVRLYEEWGYISPVPRLTNGYRDYSDLHLKQMQIARLAFQQEFVQNNLRKKATAIVRFSGQQQFREALLAAEAYLRFLQSEASFAAEAIQTVGALLKEEPQLDVLFSHQEIATQLQLTEETIRNWERNGLFVVKRNAQNRRQYHAQDLKRLLVIRTLRSAHFSIASIRQFFDSYYEEPQLGELHELLRIPKFQSDFYHVTDELEHNLKKAMTDVESIITLLKELQ